MLARSLRDVGALSELRPIEIDDLSSVRYVHTTAFRMLASQTYNPDEIEALVEQIRSPAYADQILGTEAVGAWFGDELVGTAGWSHANDTGHIARISDVFVQPLFCGLGIGSLLVKDAEERAARAGFTEVSVRVTQNAIPFFKRLDYLVSSYGVRGTLAGIDLQVAFMRKSGLTS